MPDSLEVLLVAGRFEVRGSCAYTLRLASGLAERDVSFQVVCPDAQLIPAARRRALRIHDYPRLSTPVWGELVRRFLLYDVRRADPQLIHIQSRRGLKIGNWLARRLDRPYLFTMHEHVGPGTKLPVDLEYCRRIIAVSESVRDDLLERRRLPAELVTVIPSGVERARDGSIPPPLEPGRVPVVGTAGPLEAVKGIEYFLGAARQVLDLRPQIEFLVAGAGPEESNLRRVARGLGITNHVTFVSQVLCFADSLAATDIFCLPSLQQGLGTVMLEAMAMGRPVIATAVGGPAHIIRDGQTGLIVPPQDSTALARRILELLDQPALARAIGSRARDFVSEEYNVETMLERTVQLYRQTAAVPVLAAE